jgi:N6-adenosine-specific RNA methylase IME4
MNKYKTILADPPWKYGKGFGWGAGEYYPLMKLEDICNLKVPSAENSHLYLWCPNSLLPQGLEVMKKWGFTYKTCITWAKHRSIFGYYFKGQTEQLLFGVKGKLPPNDRKQTTLINAKIRKHSQKPDEMYEIIEKVSPKLYLELFARNKREGWDTWGNEVENNIELSTPSPAIKGGD